MRKRGFLNASVPREGQLRGLDWTVEWTRYREEFIAATLSIDYRLSLSNLPRTNPSVAFSVSRIGNAIPRGIHERDIEACSIQSLASLCILYVGNNVTTLARFPFGGIDSV